MEAPYKTVAKRKHAETRLGTTVIANSYRFICTFWYNAQILTEPTTG
jgi:hypothetical protein